MSLVDNSSQIYLHFGTYDGSIFGFEGNSTSLKNLYGFTSNLVIYSKLMIISQIIGFP